jgi:hypothetical protein
LRRPALAHGLWIVVLLKLLTRLSRNGIDAKKFFGY